LGGGGLRETGFHLVVENVQGLLTLGGKNAQAAKHLWWKPKKKDGKTKKKKREPWEPDVEGGNSLQRRKLWATSRSVSDEWEGERLGDGDSKNFDSVVQIRAEGNGKIGSVNEV